MIVICPECQSRYHVDTEALGETRQVRCASCGHNWVQTPIGGTVLQNSFAPFGEASPSVASQSVSVSGARFVPLRLWLWGVSLGVFLLVASFFIHHQQKLMGQVWTNVTYFFSLFGNQTPHPQDVFKMTHLRTEVLMPHPPHKEIRLSGSIINTSPQVQTLPPLKIHFWGEDQGGSSARSSLRSESILLETRTHVLPQSHLLPGETLAFEITLAANHPHLMATSVTF